MLLETLMVCTCHSKNSGTLSEEYGTWIMDNNMDYATISRALIRGKPTK